MTKEEVYDKFRIDKMNRIVLSIAIFIILGNGSTQAKDKWEFEPYGNAIGNGKV